MFLWLLRQVSFLRDNFVSRTEGDSPLFLTGRIAGASVTAFVAAVILGPIVIAWLKKRFRERIASASATLNELHADKQDTPTMGGVFIMAAVVISTLLFADLSSSFVLIGISVVVAFTLLGAIDDWVKARRKRNGLSAKQKFAVQCLLSAAFGFFLFSVLREHPGGTDLIWPLGNAHIQLDLWFISWAALVLVASCNAVNLTDGLDGLAPGCTILAGGAFVAISYLSGHSVFADYLRIPHIVGGGEVGVMLGALVGAMLGFLWFNCFPAQVFMGDAGSLPAGALLAFAALVTRQEVLLVIIGGVFVVETLSVLVQVACFRLTGRKPLRCSPLHNHFVFRGDPETKIVIRIWIVAAILAIVGLGSLKLR